MNWLKTTIFIATMSMLLGIDAPIGLSGTLYKPPTAGFGFGRETDLPRADPCPK